MPLAETSTGGGEDDELLGDALGAECLAIAVSITEVAYRLFKRFPFQTRWDKQGEHKGMKPRSQSVGYL